MLTALVARLAQFLIALAGVRIMTTVMTPDELGKIALIFTTIAFFALLLINPVGMFFNRRLHDWGRGGNLRGFFHLYCIYMNFTALLAGIFVAGAVYFGALEIGITATTLGILVAASLIFNTINQTLVPSLNMLGHVKPFAVLTVGTLLFSLALSVLFTRIGTPTAEYWVAGTILGQAIFAGIGYAVFFRRGGTHKQTFVLVDGAQVRRLFIFCWPISIAVGLNWLQMQGYRFLIADHEGLAALGLFSAGYGVAAAMLSAMEQILTTWFQPAFYRAANSNNRDEQIFAWQRYAQIVLPLSVIGLFCVLASAPDLVVLMLGPAFHDVAVYVSLGALAEWARVSVGVFTLMAHHQLKTHLLLIPVTLGTVLTLSVILVFIPRYGLYVAPVAATLGSILTCFTLYRSACSHHYKTTLPWLALAKTISAGLIVLTIVYYARPALYLLGRLEHPAALTIVTLLFAPLIWRALKTNPL